ncbi:MAG: hypothetical protein ACM3VT_16920 [Solirubrobacterales bacterium]
MSTSVRAACVLAVVAALASVGYANWEDSFDNGAFSLTTWKWLSYPQVAGTYTQTLKTAEDGNTYLALAETSSVSADLPGAAFGIGFGSDEKFTDVRVAGTVNVTGDASHSYHGLASRSTYIVNDGKIVSGAAPGVIASCYVMHINWENGPANLQIDIEKVVQLQNIMEKNFDVTIPNLANARSYYAALDIVGSGPVYVQGKLYEYKGGPLVAETAVMVDTDGNDWWEEDNKGDAVFKTGPSGIFAQNEKATPAGFYTTFDDVSSKSDDVPAIVLSPANGATDVSVVATLKWVEAKYATGRQLWFGHKDNMQLVNPAPAGASYVTQELSSNTTYQWRVDLVGPAGTVTGDTWEFTTGKAITVEDFESYADDAAIAAAWPHNIGGDFSYVFADTSTFSQGAKSLRLEYQNQYEPFVTEATHTFDVAQDWRAINGTLALDFRGKSDNVEQPFYIRLEDEAGNKATVIHDLSYAVQSEPWRSWEGISLAGFTGVDMATVKKITVGVGGGEAASSQAVDDRDAVYIDNIRLVLPAQSARR